MKSEPVSYLVHLASPNRKLVSHSGTREGALASLKIDATRHFGTNNLSYWTDRDTVTAWDETGFKRTYHLSPYDQPVPEYEPSVDEVDAADLKLSDAICDLPAQVVIDEHGQMILHTWGNFTPMTEDELLVLVAQILGTIRADRARPVLTEQNFSASGGLR